MVRGARWCAPQPSLRLRRRPVGPAPGGCRRDCGEHRISCHGGRGGESGEPPGGCVGPSLRRLRRQSPGMHHHGPTGAGSARPDSNGDGFGDAVGWNPAAGGLVRNRCFPAGNRDSNAGKGRDLVGNECLSGPPSPDPGGSSPASAVSYRAPDRDLPGSAGGFPRSPEDPVQLHPPRRCDLSGGQARAARVHPGRGPGGSRHRRRPGCDHRSGDQRPAGGPGQDTESGVGGHCRGLGGCRACPCVPGDLLGISVPGSGGAHGWWRAGCPDQWASVRLQIRLSLVAQR